MKNTFKILTSLLLTFTLVSCNEFLDTPKSVIAGEAVFNDPSAYRSLIARIYSGLAVSGQEGPAGKPDLRDIDEGFSNYWRQYWVAQQLPTDEAVIAWGDEGLPQFHEHSWTAANQFVNAMYNRIYFQIVLANEFLRETTDEKLDGRDNVNETLRVEIQAYRAEARFLRALSYWHALDFYGGNTPFVTEDSELDLQDPPGPGDAQQFFEFIESELLEITESGLIDARQNEYGRADKAAGWMLLAKLYLNAEVYIGQDRSADALTYITRVIDAGFELEDNYQDLFLADNHTTNEMIFPVVCDGESTISFGAMTFIIRASIGGDMDAMDFGVASGWGGSRTTSTMVDYFPDENGDIDSRAIFFTEGQNKEIASITQFRDGYAVPKFRNVSYVGGDTIPGFNLEHPDTDFPMFRLGDAYLMYAEAALRSGADLSKAVEYVNDLRERAYGNTDGNITSGDLTLPFLLEERSRELYWECHRRTDLIRFNQFTENGIWEWKGGIKEGKTTAAFLNLYPIPTSDLIANTKLVQNPGY